MRIEITCCSHLHIFAYSVYIICNDFLIRAFTPASLNYWIVRQCSMFLEHACLYHGLVAPSLMGLIFTLGTNSQGCLLVLLPFHWRKLKWNFISKSWQGCVNCVALQAEQEPLGSLEGKCICVKNDRSHAVWQRPAGSDWIECSMFFPLRKKR